MSKWTNISDGKSNGFVIFYLRDGKLHPVLLSQDQADMLDLSIVIPFTEKPARVAPVPVEYDAIKEMIIE